MVDARPGPEQTDPGAPRFPHVAAPPGGDARILPPVPPHPALGGALAALVARYDRRWLDSDPLLWPRLHPDPRDREVVAVLAALLAYGRVASIHGAIREVLRRLGPSPSAALSRRPDAPRSRSALDGFRHRFTAGADVAWLLLGVARAWDEAGSLGAYVGAHARGDEPLRAGLSAWHRLAAEVARRPGAPAAPGEGVPPGRPRRRRRLQALAPARAVVRPARRRARPRPVDRGAHAPRPARAARHPRPPGRAPGPPHGAGARPTGRPRWR